MKKVMTVGVFLLLLAMFASCEEEPGFLNQGQPLILAPDGAGSSPYFPYEVGKVWNYELDYIIIQSMPEGTDTGWLSGNSLTEVIRETELTGTNPLPVWEILNTTISTMTIYGESSTDTSITTNYIHIEGDSVYEYGTLDASEPLYSYPSQPKKGNTWSINYVDGMGDTSITFYEVVADDAEANGYTNCLKIQATPEVASMYDEFELFSYMASGVGTVLNTQKTLMIEDIGEGEQMTWLFEGETRLTAAGGIAE